MIGFKHTIYPDLFIGKEMIKYNDLQIFIPRALGGNYK